VRDAFLAENKAFDRPNDLVLKANGDIFTADIVSETDDAITGIVRGAVLHWKGPN